MQTLDLKPSHAAVKNYYQALKGFAQLALDNEDTIKQAFFDLLTHCARKMGDPSANWTVVHEKKVKGSKGADVWPDGTVIDGFHLSRGYWEAKDTKDDLRVEAKKKFDKGYPKDNILFQEPDNVALYQDGALKFEGAIDEAHVDNLIHALRLFFEYRKPEHLEWEKAVEQFKEEVPKLSESLQKIIEKERVSNKKFIAGFDAFCDLCRQAINPNLTELAVERMLIQHMLTERIFRKVFNNPDFTRRNVIAAEIEKVIDALTSRAFNREDFLKQHDYFYKAIEDNANNARDYAEKQSFLNTVYERFFQGYSAKEADTHGIVYTPQPIVDFMVRSVEEILKKEFGRSLSDEGVHILDPFVGTGNFIVRVMREIKPSKLEHKYKQELHCNEIMLLPYYIASMNIEHEFHERTRRYEPFEGICLADSFDLKRQVGKFTAVNSARIENQQRQEIFVVVGNPPYNAWQENENDNNPNRRYNELDTRVAETYSQASIATNKSALSDPYIKAFRWASDRIKSEGIVAFVSNSGFLDALAADGLRKHLAKDFDEIFVLDLGGNVRRNPKLSGTTHNVFGIQVGVSINLLIRRRTEREKRICKIHYAKTAEDATRFEKYEFLNANQAHLKLDWQILVPSEEGQWFGTDHEKEFKSFLPLQYEKSVGIFPIWSNGVQTNRDAWVYNFRKDALKQNVTRLAANYNEQVKKAAGVDEDELSGFLDFDDTKIKWSSRLKENLSAQKKAEFAGDKVRIAQYRPFTKSFLYFDPVLVHRCGQFAKFYPSPEARNLLCWIKVGGDWPMFGLATEAFADQLPQGGSQCFPFFVYDEKTQTRHENISDWCLHKFRTGYKDSKITKWDIFHYVYGVLHDPEYRTRYAANLKRELPRIPYAPDFWAYAKAGKRLMELHVDYEKQPAYNLKTIETEPFTWRVEKMRLSKDKTTLTYNGCLTITDIPKEVYDYRLGNRSALEWVIDQYQVSTDKRSGIVNDPNREDDEQYIFRLIGQVITVSLETVKIVNSLPGLGLPQDARAAVQ